MQRLLTLLAAAAAVLGFTGSAASAQVDETVEIDYPRTGESYEVNTSSTRGEFYDPGSNTGGFPGLSHTDFVDFDTGTVTRFEFVAIGVNLRSDGKLVVCAEQTWGVFDLETLSFDVKYQADVHGRDKHACVLRDGALLQASSDRLVRLDLATGTATISELPQKYIRAEIQPGLAADPDRVLIRLEFYDDGTTAIEFREAEPSPFSTLGRFVSPRNVPNTGRDTFIPLGEFEVTEYSIDGEVLQQFSFCDHCRVWSVHPLDVDRVVVTTSDRVEILNLKTQRVEGSLPGRFRISFVTTDGVVIKDFGPLVWVLERDDVFITSTPSRLDYHDGYWHRFETWSMDPVDSILVDGAERPFRPDPAGGYEVDLGGLETTGSYSIQVRVGETLSPPVVFNWVAPPTLVPVEIVGGDYDGENHSKYVVVQCGGNHPMQEEHILSSFERITVMLPEGGNCSIRDRDPYATRVGPVLDDGSVVDYATFWPHYPVVAGDRWGMWVGDQDGRAHQWLLAEMSGTDSGSRSIDLWCARTSVGTFVKVSTLDLPYGQLVRLEFEMPLWMTCQWRATPLNGFDHLILAVAHADGSVQHDTDGVASAWKTRKGLLVVSDYLNHPEESFAALQNAVTVKALGRRATPGEQNYWVPLVESGQVSPGDFVSGLLATEEYVAQTAPIARLYQAYFARLPDASGMEYWTGVASSDTSMVTISQSFAQSREFTNTYGQADRRRFIELVYANVLDRAPDIEGYDYWLGQMDAGMTPAELMLYFSLSTEFENSMRPRVAVASVYLTIAGRQPTESEVLDGIAELTQTGVLAETANRLVRGDGYLLYYEDHWRPSSEPSRVDL